MLLDKPLVPIDVLAARLSVSVSTVRYWIRRGLLPIEFYVKIGQTYRFDPDGIIEHFRDNPINDVLPPMRVVTTEPDPPAQGEEQTTDVKPTTNIMAEIFSNEGADHEH